MNDTLSVEASCFSKPLCILIAIHVAYLTCREVESPNRFGAASSCAKACRAVSYVNAHKGFEKHGSIHREAKIPRVSLDATPV